jgi:peptidoglycan/LPS O-acetylase OafA/YrhL
MTSHQAHLSHPNYRPDIDGLRAIAVLSVVAFHAFPSSAKGGFIGVDVFFVISGYLISSIIFENLDKGTFSFSEFYSRRIRRIFPALLLVLIACFAFAWFALLADEFKQLGKHIAAGAGFISNFILWNEAGYFDNSAETKPLLHLWSLGIEEQFYILWPLLLWFAWKRKFNLLTITVVVAVASFILNLKGVKQDMVATFYSPQTRFWELLSGSLLAWFTLYKKNEFDNLKSKFNIWLSGDVSSEKKVGDDKTLANLLSFVGLFLLLYGFWRINKELSFPGKWALVPVLGAALIITAGPKAWVNRTILSNKIAVWFGLISFPLYLWHWPILSFTRIIESDVPNRNIRIAAIALSILLAWLTYKLVERPLRFGKKSKAKGTILVLLMAIVGFSGYITYQQDGFNFRESAVLLEKYNGDVGHLEYHKFIAEKYFICTPENIAKESLEWEGFVRCIQSKSDTDVDIALVGDSHAEHLFLGMAEALPNNNIVFYIKGSSPFIGNLEFKKIFDSIVASKSIKQVILTEHWISRYSAVPENSTLDKELIKVIDLLSTSEKSVYLTDNVPLFPKQPILCKGKRWPHSNQDEVCDISINEFIKQKEVYANSLQEVVKARPNVKIIEVGKFLCDANFCSMTKGDNILYRDSNHLNLIGSRYIGKRIVEENPDIFNKRK